MATRKKLTAAEIKAALGRGKPLAKWKYQDGKLHREYELEDFVHAFAFMSAGALEAQAMDHHPAWSNVWNKVVIDLSTHDAGGVTGLDLELAAKLESFAKKFGA